MVLDTLPEDDQASNLLELSPDGTIERYFVDTHQLPRRYCPTAR